MNAVAIILSLIVAFLWNWLVLWLGAKIIGSKEGSWKNCATLIGLGFAVVAGLIGLAFVGAAFDVLFLDLLIMGALVAGLVFLFRVTMNVLDIGFWNCVGLGLITSSLDWAASFVFEKLEGVFPALSAISEWLPF